MQFPNHANAKRQLFEPDNAVFQSDNVIADFPEVFRAAVHHRTRFRRQQLAECGLSALDLARQNGLTLHKGTHQDVWIGQPSTFAGQLSNQPIGIRKHADEPGCPFELRRQGRRHESRVITLRYFPARQVGCRMHRLFATVKIAPPVIFTIGNNRK